jgi:hypothetical protein
MVEARCPFEKPILGMQCGCEYATRNVVGERMQVGCRSPVARNNCQLLLELLTERSRFALRMTDPWQRLPFGKQMRVMIGGLVGLGRLLRPDVDAAPDNVYALVRAAQARFGALEHLPFEEIVRSVTAYRSRRHSTP